MPAHLVSFTLTLVRSSRWSSRRHVLTVRLRHQTSSNEGTDKQVGPPASCPLSHGAAVLPLKIQYCVCVFVWIAVCARREIRPVQNLWRISGESFLGELPWHSHLDVTTLPTRSLVVWPSQRESPCHFNSHNIKWRSQRGRFTRTYQLKKPQK